jgi:hypothetical protein
MRLDRLHAVLNTFWLAPITIVLPLGVWAFFFLMSPLGCNFAQARARIGSPIIVWLGSSAVFWAVIAAMFLNLVVALGRIRRTPLMTDPRRCVSCDYLLIGLCSPRCPECGTPFDAGLLGVGR